MALPKLVLWLVLAVVGLLLLSAVVSAVFAAVAFVWWLVRTAIMLAVLGGLLYGGYKLYGLLSGGSSNEHSVSRSDTSLSDSLSTGATSTEYSRSTDPVEDLQERYAKGEISETELERRLERQMVDDELDSIDRELQRERS